MDLLGQVIRPCNSGARHKSGRDICTFLSHVDLVQKDKRKP